MTETRRRKPSRAAAAAAYAAEQGQPPPVAGGRADSAGADSTPDAQRPEPAADPQEGDGTTDICPSITPLATQTDSQAVSTATPREEGQPAAGEQDGQAGTGGHGTAETAQIHTGQGTGNVNSAVESGPGVAESPHPRTRALSVTKRLQAEGRWFGQVELERDEMMRLAKDQGLTKPEAQAWVYAELDRLYPPLNVDGCSDKSASLADLSECLSSSPPNTQSPKSQAMPSTYDESGQIQGLGRVPPEWGELPANASLSAEVGWVQANRLAVVEEKPSGGTVVHLDRARSAAPSWAALGWLETSIRSYAKFVDVAAKASGGEDDEGAVMRRERRSLDEVGRLLEEMRPGPTCPTCGQSTAPERG